MTATYQRIEDLTPGDWAALARRAAQTAAAAAKEVGLTPPVEVTTVAGMSEHELVEHRNRHGGGGRRLSAVMRLVQADQLRATAEHVALTAQQDQSDAHAAATMAREEAARAMQEATAARERARELETESARKDQRRSADHAADQQTIQDLRAELARTQAELAAAQELASGAEARAEQRLAERTQERVSAEKTLQQLNEKLEKVRADTAAELAAAEEQVRAAGKRAEERTAERTAEREAAEHETQEARSELERVRADSAAAIAEAKGNASGEIARIRAAADEEVARASRAARQAINSAQSEVRGVGATTAKAYAPAPSWGIPEDLSPGSLAIPVPPKEIRTETGPIEDTLAVIQQVDDLCWQLVKNIGPDGVQFPVRGERARGLIRAVQQQAGDLSQQLHTLTSRTRDPRESEMADNYARDAANAYSGFLQRIASAADQLSQHGRGPDADVVEMISRMLDGHPWVSR